MYVCVYRETSALGHKLCSCSTFFVFRILLETMGFFRFLFRNPELSLFGFLSTVNFFFSIKYLAWARKVRVPVCADI